tara:strand:+ start:725 stop:1411 length:687 start_codon:yes stop_codon:yes gene_type:complete
MVNTVYSKDYEIHQKFLRAQRITFLDYLYLILKIPFSLLEFLVRNMPGPLGFKARYWLYKPFLKKIGKNVLIDIGVKLMGIKNISIGDYSYVESYSIISAYLDNVEIGERVHIAPFCIINASEEIKIGDFVGIAAGTKILSSTSFPNEKLMCGPTVPREHMSYKSSKIYIGDNVALNANCLLLPGAEIGPGAVVSANSVINQKIAPLDVVLGYGKVIGKRKKVKRPKI